GRTALMLACAKGNRKLVLLLCGAMRVNSTQDEIFAQDKQGQTALIHAAANGHAEVIDSVLIAVETAWEAGRQNWFAYLDHKDKESKTALDHARANKHDKAAHQIEAGFKKLLDDHSSGYDGTALEQACEKGNVPVVAGLIARGANVQLGKPKATTLPKAKNPSKGTALFRAAANGHTPVVRRLLATFGKDDESRIKYVCETTESNETALHRAAEKGHLLIVQALLEAFGDDTALCAKHADAEARESDSRSSFSTPLAVAERKGHKEIVTLLRRHGATKVTRRN